MGYSIRFDPPLNEYVPDMSTVDVTESDHRETTNSSLSTL